MHTMIYLSFIMKNLFVILLIKTKLKYNKSNKANLFIDLFLTLTFYYFLI